MALPRRCAARFPNPKNLLLGIAPPTERLCHADARRAFQNPKEFTIAESRHPPRWLCHADARRAFPKPKEFSKAESLHPPNGFATQMRGKSLTCRPRLPWISGL